ncbi:MAG: hypothetical protein MZU97_01495 [Bacillus subtilis]|nr:hypothetical protein [Bacillus subtilis]
MFLAKFFSSEGMDLLPDGYLFTLPHFLYMAASVLFVVYMVRWIKVDNPKRNKVLVLGDVRSPLVLQVRRRGRVHLRVDCV